MLLDPTADNNNNKFLSENLFSFILSLAKDVVKANRARVLRQRMENILLLLLPSPFPIIFPIQQNKHNFGVGRLLILCLRRIYIGGKTYYSSFADFAKRRLLKVSTSSVATSLMPTFFPRSETFINRVFFQCHLLVLAVTLCGYCIITVICYYSG